MSNFLVWVIWILVALACVGSGVAVITFTATPRSTSARRYTIAALNRRKNSPCVFAAGIAPKSFCIP